MFETNVSPYQLAKTVGIRPQMVYNYIKKGYIAAQTNDLGKLFVTPDVANAWVEKYLAAKTARAEAKLQEVSA